MTVDEFKEALTDASKDLRDRIKAVDDRTEWCEREIIAKGQRPYGGGGDHGWQSAEMREYLTRNTMPPETKDLSVTTDGQGVTVRGDWSDRIFKLVHETSPMRQVCSVMRTGSNALEVLVDRGEPSSAWISEVAARVETAESYLTRHAIPVHEHFALPVSSLQLLEDSIGSAGFNVENWLQMKVAARFSRQENAAAFNGAGAGSNEPVGILTYDVVPDSQFTWGADPATYVIGGQYTEVDGDLPAADVDAITLLGDLVDSLKAEYLPGASFLMTRAMRNLIRKLRDTENRFYYQPSLSEGLPDRLMGYPVRLAEDMPGLVADAVGVLFGDFRQAYTLVDRVGLTLIRDQLTRPGFVRWYARKRLGGALTNPEAVKALMLGVSPSPA